MADTPLEPLSVHPAAALYLVAYGEASPEVRAEVEVHLASCLECRRTLDALRNVRVAANTLPVVDVSDERWERMMRTATRPASAARRAARTDVRRRIGPATAAAAAALVAVAIGSFALGTRVERQRDRERAEQRDAEVAAVVALLRQPLSAERLRGVTLGSELLESDGRVSGAFRYALRNDPSPNVRLAVLDAMAGAPHRARLAADLVAALATESLPAVRLAMIDLLVRLADPRARGALESVARSAADSTVRDRARAAIAELSRRNTGVRQ